MSVIEDMRKDGYPIYTVHDNFLTNAYNSFYLPKKYLEVLTELGPPLKFINSFIYENIVQHAKDYGNNEVVLGLQEQPFTEMVLSEKLIDKLFADILPDNIQKDKQKLKVWNANVSRFKTYYYGYTRLVCCEDPSSGSMDMKWKDHMQRWETFSSRLNGMYSLHH